MNCYPEKIKREVFTKYLVSVKLDNPKEDRSAEANQCCGSKELCS